MSDFQKIFNFSLQDAERVFAEILKKGNFGELYFEYSETVSVMIEDRIVKSAGKSLSGGVGVRVIDGESTGFAFCETYNLKDIVKAGKFASAMAQSPSNIVISAFKEIEKGDYYAAEFLGEDFSLEERVNILKRLENYAFNYSASIEKVTARLTDSVNYVFVVNSEGEWGFDFRPFVSVSVSSIAVNGKNRQFGKDGFAKRGGFELITEDILKGLAEEASRKAVLNLSAKPAPAGVMPVVLAPGESGVLIHESVGHPLEADFIRKKTSAYAGRVGDKVASEKCTVIDDGTVENNTGSLNFDDELTESQKSVLIENGILKGFMSDRLNASLLGIKPSGNGRRESFKYPPLPRMRVTYLEKGQDNPEDIIKSVKKGIYCCSFAGGQVDISNGDFVFVPNEAYYVEEGKILYPVKNLTLIGNGPDVLTKVDMVGYDLKFSNGNWICGKGQSVPVGIGLPTVRISEMTVGGMKV